MNKLYRVTILTLPVPDGPNYLFYKFWLLIRYLKYFFRGKKPPFYSGHYSVTRSVIEGALKLGLELNYNPKKINDVAEIVHVLGGIMPLKQMILWKRKGLINQLSCGPNIVVRSSEKKSILASKEIDLLVNHSKWACELWAFDHPELLKRTFCWAVGVDTLFWKPLFHKINNKILIFDKRKKEDDPSRVKHYVEFLRSEGWEVNVLTRCGQMGYSINEYRSLLHDSILMIGFTVGSESQGIAWAEAWATNTPTLILQNLENEYEGLKYKCSTAPFLSHSTGAFFTDFEDFKIKFLLWKQNKFYFEPRKWVLNNMSDEICAENLYNLLINQKI